MRNSKIRFIGMLMYLAAFIVSCNQVEKQELTPEKVNSLEQVVEQANQDYLNTLVTGGDEKTPFFVNNEGLIDEYLAGESSIDNSERSDRNRLVSCLRSTNLTGEQIPQVRRALNALQKRNETLVKRHREAFSQLRTRVENRRNELISQVNSGEIDRQEFHAKITYLRDHYKTALSRIKESNAEGFKHSHSMFMEHLKNILSERQWNAFLNCLKDKN